MRKIKTTQVETQLRIPAQYIYIFRHSMNNSIITTLLVMERFLLKKYLNLFDDFFYLFFF